MFICHICVKKYKSQDTLNIHNKKYHNIIIKSNNTISEDITLNSTNNTIPTNIILNDSDNITLNDSDNITSNKSDNLTGREKV